tara:strand:- start:795 stop:1106 length:312 start_codon:yes stop_codon:yes gene_type:complete
MKWIKVLKAKPYGHNVELTYSDEMFIAYDEPSIPKNEYHKAKALLYVIQLEEGDAKAKSKLAYLRDTGILPYDYVMDKYDSGEYNAKPEKLPTGEVINWEEVE